MLTFLRDSDFLMTWFGNSQDFVIVHKRPAYYVWLLFQMETACDAAKSYFLAALRSECDCIKDWALFSVFLERILTKDLDVSEADLFFHCSKLLKQMCPVNVPGNDEIGKMVQNSWRPGKWSCTERAWEKLSTYLRGHLTNENKSCNNNVCIKLYEVQQPRLGYVRQGNTLWGWFPRYSTFG